MQLSKQCGYALRIVCECAARGGQLTRISDAAARYKITKNNVAKVVPVLVRHGIIETERGRSGGIRLARPASEITIGEVVRAIEVTRVAVDSIDGETNRKAPSAASINKMLGEALDAFISVLDRHSVAELASGSHRIESLAQADSEPKAPREHHAAGQLGTNGDSPKETGVSA